MSQKKPSRVGTDGVQGQNGRFQRFPSPPPLASGASTLAERRLVYQTQKLKEARSAFMEKLEVYRQQYEEMHVRALAAELEVTSLQLQSEKLSESLSQSEDNVKFLANELSAQKKLQSERDKKFKRFQSRLSEIRTALTAEVDKLRLSEKDLRIAMDSVSRCVLEFQNEAISKEDFLFAIGLIISTVTGRERVPSPPTANRDVVFGYAERERLASLPRDLRKTRLQELMNLLNERELGVGVDDDVLNSTPSPPPIPPRESPSLPQKATNGLAEDSGAQRHSPAVQRRINNSRVSSDSDCSDFEHFVPPNYPRKRYRSEPYCANVRQPLSARIRQTSFPHYATSSCLQNSSPVLTRKPSWLEKKQRRSKSLGSVGHHVAAASMYGGDSDDNERKSSLDSLEYATPLEHLMVVRRAHDTSNILTGSLPQINKALDDSDYLDPSEIAMTLLQSGNRRLRRRMSTVVSCTSENHYLSLISPDIPLQAAAASTEQVKEEQLNFPGRRDSGPSGDATTPGEFPAMKNYNGYAEIPAGNGPQSRTNRIYEELKSPKSVSRPEGKSGGADPAMKSDDGYCRLDDTVVGFSLNVGPQTCPLDQPPSPPPRKPIPHPRKKLSTQKHSVGAPPKPSDQNLGLGPLPLYTTLRGRQHRVQLVPLSPYASSDEHALSDGERPEHLYSLGRFVTVNPLTGNGMPQGTMPVPVRRATHSVRPTLQQLRLMEATSALESSDAEEREGGREKPVPVRSYTYTSSITNSVENKEEDTPVERSGYLRKMGPKQKHWTRRWFVLKGSELKYYRSKESFLGMNRPRGTIDIASWCKLTRDELTAAFQLATPKRTYYLMANSQQDCQEWITVLQVAMRAPLESTVLKPKAEKVSGWATMTQKRGSSERVWCELDTDSLTFSPSPGEVPQRRIRLQKTTIKKVRDSLLLDSKSSSGNLHGMFLAIEGAELEREGQGEKGGNNIYLAPESKDDQDRWYYHLSAASAGDLGPVLTHTERLLAQLMEAGGVPTHPLWKHPLLTCTAGPLRTPLTSLASAELTQQAKDLFQSVQLFLSTPIDPLGLDYHLLSVQSLLAHGLRQPQLQDELYCQVLRQISGHTQPTASPVLQGWFLVFLMLPMFLPSRKMVRWYLQTFIERHISSPHTILAEYAQQCQLHLERTERCGGRECKPSWFELQSLMFGCVHKPTLLQDRLKISVYLMNGTTQEMEFNPFTTVEEFTSELNQRVGLPEPYVTGFALMSDWPGSDDPASFYLFPNKKLCDIISMWTDALEELNHLRGRQHRGIMLTYLRRLHHRQHQGKESDREAILLTHQLSKEVLSGRHPITNMETGVRLAALVAQIEYGDLEGVASGGEGRREAEGSILREALQYCPSRFTHHALEHDQNLLQQKLAEQWGNLKGMRPEQCAWEYLGVLQQWSSYGATLFSTQELFSSYKRRFLWLAVHEGGISLLDHTTMDTMVSYSYSEVSTFGSHGDDFVLVVSPQHKSPGNQLQSEKILLAMPKLQIREATFLIARYLKSYEGPQPNQTPPGNL